MTTVLAVSPHLDDAAFSAGGTLARLAAAGAQVVVATVFTATVAGPQGFALACQLDKGLGPEVDYMALRREEDLRACAALDATARHLPFREAPHRGYGSAPALFSGLRDDDIAADAVGPVLRTLLAELEPDLILAPQAIGAHVDHIAVVHALRAAEPGAPVAWWRDHPYVLRPGTPAEPFSGAFHRLPVVQVELDPAAQAVKTAAALTFESQLGFQFGDVEQARRVFEGAEPVERLRTQAEGVGVLENLLGRSPSARRARMA